MSDTPDTELTEAPAIDPGAPEFLPTRFYVVADPDGVVTAALATNLPPENGIEVATDVFLDARSRLGRCALLGDVLVDHDPAPEPTPLPLAVPKLGLIRALMAAGLWPPIRDYLASDVDLLFQWNAASSIARADPLTVAVIAKFQLTDDQVNRLMQAAVTATAT